MYFDEFNDVSVKTKASRLFGWPDPFYASLLCSMMMIRVTERFRYATMR